MPEDSRALIARIASHSRWAHCADPVAATAPAREAFLARFEHDVDPERILTTEERARRAEHAKKAYFLRLALKSAQVRSTKSTGRRKKAAG